MAEIYNRDGDLIYQKLELESDRDRELIRAAIADGIDLSHADFRNRNLTGVRFYDVDLRDADFVGSILIDAYFQNTDLRFANFADSNAKHVHFYTCNLSDAKFAGAYLTGSYMARCILTNADFRDARIDGVVGLNQVDGCGMTWETMDIIKGYNTLVPSEGSFIAWKAVCAYVEDSWDDEFDGLKRFYNHVNLVAKLKIPEDAGRTSSLDSRKCRASQAEVLGFYHPETRQLVESAIKAKPLLRQSPTDDQYFYKVGEMSIPDRYEDSMFLECTNGIHFFMSFIEAADWAK
jgi:hypothetical protein